MAWIGWERLKAFGAMRHRFLSPVPPEATDASKPEARRDTFCVLAWNHLQIAPNGTAKMCCIAGEDISRGKRPMSLYTDAYDDIWNSDYMRNARRGMAQGEKITACQRCYDEEDSVGESRRTSQNAIWHAESEEARQALIEDARAQDWRVTAKPVFLQLNMGNLCNLACRMCSSQYSSRIENDPVHNKWMPAAYPDVARWVGNKLRIGPRPLFNVSYSGFNDYEASAAPPVRWSSQRGTIELEIPAGTELETLGLSLRTAGKPVAGKIYVNGLEVFDGTFTLEWTKRFRLAGLGNQSRLEIAIETATRRIGGRRVGIGLLDVWIERAAGRQNQVANERTLMRYADNAGWWAEPEVMFGEILGEADRLRYIVFQGGEPFLVKEFDHILDVLIANGSASEVTFEIVSNLTTIKDSTLSKLARLKQVHLGASIDGIGPILEYIRYPAVWTDIEHNLERCAALPNVAITFNTAIQAYNLGDVVDILSYCDRCGIDVHMHFLVGPAYLNVAVLPQEVRRAAISRITAYLTSDSARPINRNTARYVIRFLEEHLPIWYGDEFPSFVQFTNDMDISRGQSFRALYPGLIDAFAENGLAWTDETRFARTAAAA